MSHKMQHFFHLVSSLNVYLLYIVEQVAVLGALSNMVLDFSSAKSPFIEYGGIKQLIELSKSMDPNARCSALRALRNLMFLADNKRKELFYSDVKAQGLASLISGKSFSTVLKTKII